LQRYEITLTPISSGGSNYMPPDTGAVFNVFLDVESDATPGAVVNVDTLTWTSHVPLITTVYGEYWPEFSMGKVVVKYSGCCGLYTGGYTGNTNCDTDGKRNLADITQLISRVYLNPGTPLCCEENGNTNGDPGGTLNLADITNLIDHVYISQAETAPCP
jgi:hypothetical protein